MHARARMYLSTVLSYCLHLCWWCKRKFSCLPLFLLLTNHNPPWILINASFKHEFFLWATWLHLTTFPIKSIKSQQRKKNSTWNCTCTCWSVTLNDISVVMVKPWVMTGSSSVVRPFQQSSSMQRQPDRRTCLYISTEEFPASWPAALHKETNSTWGCIDPQSTTACASMFRAMKKNATAGQNLIALLPLGNQLPPQISSKLYRNMLGILSKWETDVRSHFRRHHSFHRSNLWAVDNDRNASPRRTKMNRLLSPCHKNNRK